jgi:hypothetical protein
VPERRYREGMERVPGHVAAGKLLNGNHGSHKAAWEALGIFDMETAQLYMQDQAKAALEKGGEPEQVAAIIEVSTMFALTAVLADRERRAEDEEHEQRVEKRQRDQQREEPKDSNGDPIPF